MTPTTPTAYHKYKGATTLTADKNICFDDVVGVLAGITQYMYLIDTIRTGAPSITKKSFHAKFESNTDGVDRGFYPYDLAQHLAANTWPDSITIYDDLRTVDAPKGPPVTTGLPRSHSTPTATTMPTAWR